MRKLRIAIIDLYNNEPNLGIRAIRSLIDTYATANGDVIIDVDRYETRFKSEVPGLDYDLYISSGGPGSPIASAGSEWEGAYFKWLEELFAHNQRRNCVPRRAFFICHSFQMLCRFLGIGTVMRRSPESFGLISVMKTGDGKMDPILDGVEDVFCAADFRKWQVVEPRWGAIKRLGAKVIAVEVDPPDQPYGPALMGLRVSPYVAGVQFHPEASPSGMLKHFSDPTRRESVVRNYGLCRYESMITDLQDGQCLKETHDAVLPVFLERTLAHMGSAVVGPEQQVQ